MPGSFFFQDIDKFDRTIKKSIRFNGVIERKNITALVMEDFFFMYF